MRKNFVFVICCMCVQFSFSNELPFFKDIELNPIISFDEVPIVFIVNGYIQFETDVFITESNKVYINIQDLFKNLGIQCAESNYGNNLVGFIENETKKYDINFEKKQITVGKTVVRSVNGIVKEFGSIYIESTVIAEAFGLVSIFNYRSLSIKLESNFELPLVKEMRIEKMRQNILKIQDSPILVDTIVNRNYHLFKAGVLDWSFDSYQAKNESPINRFGVGLGAELLYGQATFSMIYDDHNKFDSRQLNYNWRWVDNDKTLIKQAQLGKVYGNSISFLNGSIIGGSISNSPNTVRKAKGFHTINEYTEPNWTVELYINDVLIDFTTSDASGLFEFKVPIVYGYTTLKLKYYGPLGEERTEERTMNVPFTFIPAKTLEYNVTGGVLDNSQNNKYGKGEINYGINNYLTVGVGMEYLNTIPDYPYIPFATLAFQPFSKMVINLEYAQNVRMKGLLNYYFGNSAFLEIDYSKYKKDQKATLFNANEERRIRLSLPYKTKKISGSTKLNYNQNVYDGFNYNQFDAVFSGYYKNYSANIATLLNWVSDKPSYLTSIISLSYRMHNGLIFRPSVDFAISDKQVIRYRAEIEKRISKMNFSASFERNMITKSNNMFLSFRYDLPFARAGMSTTYYNDRFSFSENIQGSLAFGGDNYVQAGHNSTLGKGGILFYPFLDLNQNGKFDKGEQRVLLTNVRVTGGKAVISEKDSIVRISDLNAFINYTIEFSDENLDNISWRFKHKTYQVLVDPNQYKKVDVPILVMGEVSGMVYLNENEAIKGQGRITLQIFDEKDQKVTETLSESDGYFSYLGLKPGNYSVRVDPQQLEKLNYFATPTTHTFNVVLSEEGSIISGLTFNLKSNLPEPIKVAEVVSIIPDSKTDEKGLEINASIIPEEKTAVHKEKVVAQEVRPTTQNDKNKIIVGPYIDPSFVNIGGIEGDLYSVQIGAFKKEITTKDLFELSPIYFEKLPNGFVRYLYGNFKSIFEAIKIKNNIASTKIKDAFVVRYQNGFRVNTENILIKKQFDQYNKKIHGTVELNHLQNKSGVKNMSILLFDQNDIMVGITTTNENGSFEISNLISGLYTLKMDSDQLKELQFIATPLEQNIIIKSANNQDVFEAINIVLTNIKE